MAEKRITKNAFLVLVTVLLLAGCGATETQGQNLQEMQDNDAAAMPIVDDVAVMPIVESEPVQAADVMCLNNEFTYSTGGSPMDGKAYTFRAAPGRVEVLKQLGVDVVKPVYFEIDGKTVAFVAASRAEKNKMTPQATGEKPGILRCYDTELFQQVIAEADASADFVLAYVHWGTEYSYELEEAQLTTGGARENLFLLGGNFRECGDYRGRSCDAL